MQYGVYRPMMFLFGVWYSITFVMLHGFMCFLIDSKVFEVTKSVCSELNNGSSLHNACLQVFSFDVLLAV